ncbi:hypothetical protein FACS189454_09260 [Planctomycetales bacterium]|nr:hypothetical protein FACS189454_09260 [Planctomycetales bacterium]
MIRPVFRIVSRLALLVLVLALLFCFRVPLAKYAVIANIQHQSGADAAIESLDIDWKTGSVLIRNLRIVHPRQPKNAATIQEIKASFDADALRRREMMIEQLDVSDIDIQFDVAEGQTFIPNFVWNEHQKDNAKDGLPISPFDWLAVLSDKPEKALDNITQSFEARKIIDEQKVRWQNVIDETKTKGLVNVLGQLPALKQQAEQDYKTLSEAVRRDKEKLQNVQTPQIKSNEIAESLVGSNTQKYWDQLYVWRDYIASLASPSPDQQSVRQRYGRFIPFPNQNVKPLLSIRKTNLTGQIRFGELPAFFNAAINDIAQPPETGTAPLTAQCAVSGNAVPVSPVLQDRLVLSNAVVPDAGLTLLIDHLDGHEIEKLTVCCPAYQLAEYQLGEADKPLFHVSPGLSRLDSILELNGENISGGVRLIQTDIRVTLAAKNQSKITDALKQSLSQMNRLEATVLVSGTRKEPKYTFKSNLADILTPQLETLLASSLNDAKYQIDQSLTKDTDDTVRLLNSVVQGLLNPSSASSPQNSANPTAAPVDQLIDKGLQKLPGLFDKLNDKLKNR